MKLATRVPRAAVLTALMVALALFVAACGSSSSSSTSGKKSSTSTTASAAAKKTFAAYTACLKSHGVATTALGRGGAGIGFGGARGTSTIGAPSTARRPTGSSTTGGFPGAGPGAGGGPGLGGGTSAGNSRYAKAAKACASKLPKGNFGAGGGFRGRAGSAAAGKSMFTTKELDAYVACIRKNGYAAMPEPSTKGGAVFPKSIAANAKFKAASQKCESLLRPATTGGSQTTATVSST